MGKAIAISNQKGGVGKTTTAINLASCLGERSKKVLALDMDPQGNMTSGFGLEKNDLDGTSYELLIGAANFSECVQKDVCRNVDLIPANIDLSAAEIELADIENKEYLMRETLASVKDDYDYIIIDCPPSLSLLTVNALTTADSVLIPIQCEYYSLEGLGQLLYTVNLVKQRLNPTLEVEGILFTMFDRRTNLTNQVVDNVRENLDYYVFKTIIPRNVRLAEAPSHGLPINYYDKRSSGAESYSKLAKELLRKRNR